MPLRPHHITRTLLHSQLWHKVKGRRASGDITMSLLASIARLTERLDRDRSESADRYLPVTALRLQYSW